MGVKGKSPEERPNSEGTELHRHRSCHLLVSHLAVFLSKVLSSMRPGYFIKPRKQSLNIKVLSSLSFCLSTHPNPVSAKHLHFHNMPSTVQRTDYSTEGRRKEANRIWSPPSRGFHLTDEATMRKLAKCPREMSGRGGLSCAAHARQGEANLENPLLRQRFLKAQT